MPEENTSPAEQGTGTPTEEIPTDYREYERWRRTGELPAKPEDSASPAAANAQSEPAQGEPATQAKTAPDSGTEDSHEQEEPPEARPGSRERRIDKLTRENAELRRLIEERQKPGEEPQPPAPAKPAGKPDLKDFKTLEEYTEALTDWKLDQREAKRKQEAAAAEQQNSWTAKEAAALKVHPDYREVMDATPIPQGPGVMAAREALLETDNGAEVLYWLATRPEELARVAALSPAKAILEVGKISASLSAAPPPATENPKPKVTGAPKPPSPITHAATRTADDVYDESTARDFKRWNKVREAQLKG